MAYNHPTLSIGDQVEYRKIDESGKPAAQAIQCYVAEFIPVRENGAFKTWKYKVASIATEDVFEAAVDELRPTLLLLRQFTRRM